MYLNFSNSSQKALMHRRAYVYYSHGQLGQQQKRKYTEPTESTDTNQLLVRGILERTKRALIDDAFGVNPSD
ncbi:hypothetical protein ACTXT7_008523 [Hymenolepis weldensis]